MSRQVPLLHLNVIVYEVMPFYALYCSILFYLDSHQNNLNKFKYHLSHLHCKSIQSKKLKVRHKSLPFLYSNWVVHSEDLLILLLC